jgi:hypothetical protein
MRSGAVVAGNRYGLQDVIKAPSGAANLWRAFAEALRKAKTPAANPLATAAVSTGSAAIAVTVA